MKTARKRKRNLWPLSLFSRTTVQHVRRGPKLTSAGRDVYKGHRMYSVGDGSWQVPSIDRESTFDDKRQAKRFVDAWTKKNPHAASIPRGRWIEASVRITKSGKIQAKIRR